MISRRLLLHKAILEGRKTKSKNTPDSKNYHTPGRTGKLLHRNRLLKLKQNLRGTLANIGPKTPRDITRRAQVQDKKHQGLHVSLPPYLRPPENRSVFTKGRRAIRPPQAARRGFFNKRGANLASVFGKFRSLFV